MRLIWLFAVCAAAQAQSLDVLVVNSVTGAPVPKAMIGLISTEFKPGTRLHVNMNAGMVADQNGRGHFATVKPGEYRVSAQLKNYTPGRGKVVSLTDGGAVAVEVELIPYPSVSGRVLDGKGQPVPDAIVAIAPVSILQSPETPVQWNQMGGVIIPHSEWPKNTTSGKSGEFAFQVPGDTNYILEALPPKGIEAPAAENGRERAWAPTYYPGLPTRQGAGPLVVRPGSDLGGLDIKLLAAPLHHVRGVLLDPKGNALPHTGVKLDEEQIVTGDDGSFDFQAIDGERLLSCELEDESGYRKAAMPLTIGGRDLENVKLRLAESFSIDASVTVEPPLPFGTPYERAAVLLEGVAPTADLFRSGATDITGHLKLDKVLPGTYTLRGDYLYRTAQNGTYYLAAIRLDNREVLGSPESLTGPARLELVYRNDFGSAKGTVEGGAGAVVVLQPRIETLRLVGSQTVSCDGSGPLQIPILRPGEYYAWVMERGETVPLFAQHLTEELARKATLVTVRPGETTTIQLKK